MFAVATSRQSFLVGLAADCPEIRLTAKRVADHVPFLADNGRIEVSLAMTRVSK